MRQGKARQRHWWRGLRQTVRRLLVLLLTVLVIGLLLAAPATVSGQLARLVVLGVVVVGALLLVARLLPGLLARLRGRARTYWVLPAQGGRGIRFADYQGNPAALAAAAQVVALLAGVQGAPRQGSRLLRGLLLVGPPGVGKRYLAQAIATEAGLPIGYLNAPSLTITQSGSGAEEIAHLYRAARRLARDYGAALLLIDEIAPLGAETSTDAGRGILHELLLQIDPPFQRRAWWQHLPGLGSTSPLPVLTIATTSRPEALDPALLRPGRFDRRIVLDLPDAAGRQAIIAYYLNRTPHEPLVVAQLAAELSGATPATIKTIIGEAAIYAHQAGRQAIRADDIEWARMAHAWQFAQPVSVEPPTPPRSYAQRRRRAYYEAGRVYLCAHLMGAVQMPGEPDEAEGNRTRDELLTELQCALAGRATEEEVLGIQTTGAVADLARATRLALLLHGAFGMQGRLAAPLAALVADGSDRSGEPGEPDELAGPGEPDGSDGARLHAAAEALLQEEYRRVRALVAANRQAMTTLAEALILRSGVRPQEIEHLLQRIEAHYPFTRPSHSTAPHPVLVARRALPRASALPNQGGPRFADPAPALADVAPVYVPPQPAPEPVPERPGRDTQPLADAGEGAG